MFVDSRFAQGTATDFTVEIPEGGLDLPDNCVAYVDQISVPSVQNVPYTRTRVYYKESVASGQEKILMVELFPWNYSQASLAQNIQNKLNTKTAKLISATYDVSYTTSGNFIEFKLSGGAAGDSARILTDQELRELAYHPPYWRLDSGTWAMPYFDMAGLWHNGPSLGEPVLYTHEADLSTNSEEQDNWVVESGGVETGETIKITQVSTWSFLYDRGGVQKTLNVTFMSASTFSVTDGDGLVFSWNAGTQRLLHPSGTETWAPRFTLEIEAIPGTFHTVTASAERWWYVSPPVSTFSRFYMVGSSIYPDPLQVVTGYQFGIYDSGTNSITWGPGSTVWTRATTPTDSTLPLTIRTNGQPETNRYTLDYSQLLPSGASISYGIPGVTTKNFTQTNITPNGSVLHFEDGSTATHTHTLLGTPTTIAYHGVNITTTDEIPYQSSELPSDFDNMRPKSINGILNNESGVSEVFTTSNTMRKATDLTYEDECVYLHMVPSANNTLSCMGTPSRTIVRRIPMKEPYPMQNHNQQSGQEFDFLNVSSMQLRRLQFTLTFADGSVVPPRGHVSFSILFAVID